MINMTLITKENLEDFLKKYHMFHDSTIESINYLVKDSKIEVTMNVWWENEKILKEDGTYNTNKHLLRFIFNNVEECKNREIFSWDYVDEIFIKYIKIQGKELICFASDERDPFIYIVCETIEYEKVDN